MKDRAAGPTTSFTTRPARKGSKAARRCRSRSSCGPSRATTERASGPDLEIALLDGPAGVVRARAAELGFPNACDPAAPVSGEMADLHDAVALRQDTPVSVSLLLRRLLRFDWHVARVAAAPDESDRDSGDHRVATVAIPRQWFRDRWPEPDPSNRQMVQLLGPATRRTRKPAPPTLVSRPRRRYAGAMPTIDHCPGCPYREFGPAVGPRGCPAARRRGRTRGTDSRGSGRWSAWRQRSAAAGATPMWGCGLPCSSGR